jgi:ABC-2 type transport system ATP-binding protein
MTAVVEAESLTKRFGEVSAVTDLSFALEAGDDHGLSRPERRCKTTTLRMLLSLVAPTSGRAGRTSTNTQTRANTNAGVGPHFARVALIARSGRRRRD